MYVLSGLNFKEHLETSFSHGKVSYDNLTYATKRM